MNQLQPILSILEDTQSEQLSQITAELSDAWHKRQIFRTDTEARYAVLNDFKFPTKASKYWQAVREQTCHLDELTSLSFELRRKQITLREIEDKLTRDKMSRAEVVDGLSTTVYSLSTFDRERLEVDRDEILFHIASAQQVAKDRVREIMQWSQIKKELNDGSFDDKDPNTHQRESLFKIAVNHAQHPSENMSSEEKLSIKGILYSLGKEPVNQIGESDGKKING